MAGYSYHGHWQDDDARDGLIDFEQYYTFPPRPNKNHHANSQGIFHRLLKRQYRQVDDSCQYTSKKQQLASQSSKSLSRSKTRQRGTTADLRSDQQPCQAAQGLGSRACSPTAMRVFSSANNLGARHNQCNLPDQPPRRSSGVGGAPSASTTITAADHQQLQQQQQQPNIFSRLLRRAQSKKALKLVQPSTAAEEQQIVPPLPTAAKEPRKDVAATCEDGQKTATMERKSTLRLKKSIRARFRGPEQLPRQPESTESKKAPAVYVPRHAATDFSRTAVPNPDAAARFASFDEGRRRPSSSSNAPASPTLVRPRTSPGHHHTPRVDEDDDYFQPPQQPLQLLQPQQNDYHAKRRSWAPTSHTESRSKRFSFASYNAEADYTTAAPPLSPASIDASDEKTPLRPSSSSDQTAAAEKEQRPRQSQRHSYRLVPDPHDAVIEEETDFQRFLSKAAEEDRQYRQDLWRTLSTRSRAAGLAGLLPPPEPDLDLQALLGGADWHANNADQPGKEPSKQEKRASNSHRKRASMVSYRSQTDRTGKPQPDPVPAVPLIVDTKVVKRKPSMSKRVQEYFRPEALANLRD
ncbi:hypothetical protein PG985_004638 [Apiospora marii]|uniref:uncharacterized protein n=1 Tax=Apiospora marii TaxID=335849 RepID=UPI00312DE299